MNITYEDKLLANDILQRHFYDNFRNPEKYLKKKSLEIFLTGACRANCDYCYLKQNMHQLYPVDLHNEDQIVHNVQLIVQWYKENAFKCNIEIFSADWIGTPLAEKIFKIFYEEFKNSEYKPPAIVCPDNMQFLKDEKLTQQVESYINLMESIGICLALSASIDGKYCDTYRTTNSDDYYERLINFLKKHSYLVHPMISAQNAKYQINNFAWMLENFGTDITYHSTMLEVRNSDWDTNSIQDLIQFCDYLADTTFDLMGQNKLKMLKYVFHIRDFDNDDKLFNHDSHNPIRLPLNSFSTGSDVISCSFSFNLCIRAADLTIAPCHRLFYPLLHLGHFNVADNKIVDFIPTNVSLMAGQRHMKRSCMPICEHCGLLGICIGHCLGASYEEYGNMMIPQMEVCQMLRSKTIFLIYKFHTMGLFDELPNIKHLLSDEEYHYLTDLISSILEDMT